MSQRETGTQTRGRQYSRRDVLKTAGYAAAGVALAGSGLLAACSGGASGSKPADSKTTAPNVTGQAKPTLRVWLFKHFVDSANKTVEAQVRKFAELKNIEVQIEFSSFGDIFTKYASAIDAGNPPDVGQIDHVSPVRYHGMDQLVDLSDVVADVAERSGGFNEDGRVDKMTKFEGKWWAVPLYSGMSFFYYRADKLKEKSLQVPNTWQEVVDVAGKINDPANGFYGFGQTINRSFDGDGFMEALLWSHGSSWVDETGKKVVLKDNPATKQAVQFAIDLFLKEPRIEPTGAEGWTDPSNNEAWAGGKIGMTNNGGSIWGDLVLKSSPLKDSTGVAQTPGGPKGRFTEDTGYNWCVFKKSKNVDLAKELIKYMMGPEQFLAFQAQGLGVAAPYYKRHATDQFWTSHANYKAMAENGRNAVFPGYPGPVTIAAAEVRAQHVLTDLASNLVQSKGQGIDAAIETAHKKIQGIYDQYK